VVVVVVVIRGGMVLTIRRIKKNTSKRTKTSYRATIASFLVRQKAEFCTD